MRLNYPEYASGAINKIEAARREVADFGGAHSDPAAKAVLGDVSLLLSTALDKVRGLRRSC